MLVLASDYLTSMNLKSCSITQETMSWTMDEVRGLPCRLNALGQKRSTDKLPRYPLFLSAWISLASSTSPTGIQSGLFFVQTGRAMRCLPSPSCLSSAYLPLFHYSRPKGLGLGLRIIIFTCPYVSRANRPPLSRTLE